jgi:L-ribulose-5-phosphate 3-epimerase
MLIRPSVHLSVLPAALPLEERIAFAADLGFEGVEVELGSGPPERIRAAADRAGITVHSINCLGHYETPLSSGDPAVAKVAVERTIATVRAARVLGAGKVRVIPGVVDAETTYGDVYSRSLDVLKREILPVAEQQGIILAVENVWNGFLLSPMDFAAYIDAFDTPWVRAYLDVGNILFGRPEGWIEILGDRICELHVKDLTLSMRAGRFRPARIGEGDIDWGKVRRALERVGYSGWAVLAEPDLTLPRIRHALYRRMVGRAAPPLPASMAGAVQKLLAGRLLGDALRRYRRHLAPEMPRGLGE